MKTKLHAFPYYATVKILPELSISTLVGGDGFFITFGWIFLHVQFTIYYSDDRFKA